MGAGLTGSGVTGRLHRAGALPAGRNCSVLGEVRIQAACDEIELTDDLVIIGDNSRVLLGLPDCTFDLVYMDPPFNTGRAQARRTLEVLHDVDGDRVGFGGRRYRSRLLRTLSYDDEFADYLGFLEPRVQPRARAAGATTGRCTSTSTIARRTTASCCSTRCSGATRSSTS